MWARRNRNRFFEMVLPKAKGNPADEQEQENQRKERKSIGEIRRIIEQVEEQANAELLADVPAVTRARTQAMLGDWARRFGLALPDGAQAALEARVAQLVKDSTGAMGRASGGV